MTAWPLEIPVMRAAAWFAEEPGVLPEAGGPFPEWLDVAWGAPDVASVEPLQRRRLSRLARAFCHCAARVGAPPGVRVVYASRHGEVERTLTILQDLAQQAEVSPTLFSLSVHNAVPGVWSILTGTRAPATSLAAGPDTLGWGLVEAAAALGTGAPGQPVLFLYADEQLPEPWAASVPAGFTHALALLLGDPAPVRLALGWNAETAAPEPDLPPAIPCLRALLAAGRQEWTGPGGAWSWEIA
jgi:hypothetical protein